MDPSGRQPPLIKHPTAPWRFNSFPSCRSLVGDVAANMLFRTIPSQCLHFKEQEDPVREIEGNAVGAGF